jgi:hypothetical protein
MLGALEKNGKHPTPEPLKMTRLIGNKQNKNEKKHVHSNSNSNSIDCDDCDDYCLDLCCGCGMSGTPGFLCLLCDD